MPMRDCRRYRGRVGTVRRSRAKPGEFAADELALMLRDQPYQVRCLVARARRMAAALPTVWEAFRRGEVDAEQIRVIDLVARRVTETATLAAIDEQAVDAADTRSPKQLQVWLLRLVVQLEPLAFAQRHRRALAERRVTVVQGTDGMGYVTGEVSARCRSDRCMLAAAPAAWVPRILGPSSNRADLLLGRIAFTKSPEEEEEEEEEQQEERKARQTTQNLATAGPHRGGRRSRRRRAQRASAEETTTRMSPRTRGSHGERRLVGG
jgi:hypothetical protein